MSHLRLDVAPLVGLVLCPSAALFSESIRTAYATCDVQSFRLSLVRVCPVRVDSGRGNGGEARAFLLPFPAGNLPGHRRPSRSRRPRQQRVQQLGGRCHERSRRRVFPLSRGQGWRLLQFSLRRLDCTPPGTQLDSPAFPQPLSCDSGARECVNYAAVHTC